MISTHFWVTMNDDITKIRSELEKITVECDADWVAFSGGLDSSILASIKKEQCISALTIITKDFLGTDLSYSQISAKPVSYTHLRAHET